MSGTTITPVASWDDVSSPLDNEAATSGDIIEKFVQPLANRDAYLSARLSDAEGVISGHVTSIAGLSTRTSTLETTSAGLVTDVSFLKGSRKIRLNVNGRGCSPTGFTEYTDGIGGKYWMQTSGPGVIVAFDISDLLPQGASILEYSASLRGGSGHESLPETMPIVSICTIASGDISSAWTVVAYETDASASVAIYEAYHEVGGVISGGHEISTANRYYLRVSGEEGTGYLAGLLVLDFAIKTKTVTS